MAYNYNVPYATFAYIALNCIIFALQFFCSILPQRVALCFDDVLSSNSYKWYCYITSQLTHVDLVHISMNLLSFYSLKFCENIFGSLNYALLILFFIFDCPLVTMILIAIIDKTNISHTLRFQYMMGFSGVLFALSSFSIVLLNGARYNVFGLNLPAWAFPFVSLAITQFLVPSASLVGHLAGVIAGFSFIPIYKWVLPDYRATRHAGSIVVSFPAAMILVIGIVLVLHIVVYYFLKWLYGYHIDIRPRNCASICKPKPKAKPPPRVFQQRRFSHPRHTPNPLVVAQHEQNPVNNLNNYAVSPGGQLLHLNNPPRKASGTLFFPPPPPPHSLEQQQNHPQHILAQQQSSGNMMVTDENMTHNTLNPKNDKKNDQKMNDDESPHDQVIYNPYSNEDHISIQMTATNSLARTQNTNPTPAPPLARLPSQSFNRRMYLYNGYDNPYDKI